ncbi:hypothetical protein PG995_000895 [Apiospora arundinis]
MPQPFNAIRTPPPFLPPHAAAFLPPHAAAFLSPHATAFQRHGRRTPDATMSSFDDNTDGDWELVSRPMSPSTEDPGAELEHLYNCSIVTMEPAPENMAPSKTCLVTVGATASFRSLITEMVTPKVVSALAAQGFDTMIVQCGPDLDYFESIKPSDPEVIMGGYSVVDNIVDYMRQCCPSDEHPKRSMGLIISHAGAGNLMEAVRLNTKVITVPNTDLMDNHQVELAECFAESGWAIHSQIGHIHEAIEKSVTFQPADFPPRSPPGSKKRGLEQITQDIVNGTWNDDKD